MTTLTIALDPLTADWLNKEAVALNQTQAEFVSELLRQLADPDRVEGDLIDRLLAEAAHSFPPVMTLDEQTEMREEVLDSLCHRLVETYREMLGVPMTPADRAAFRRRLEARSKTIWG
jgi:hypothetical protein